MLGARLINDIQERMMTRIANWATDYGERHDEHLIGRERGGKYKDLDLVGRAAESGWSADCGLGGLDPDKNGWANLAKALAARLEYF